MSEILKLQKRVKNMSPNSTEYRMTAAEAKKLLDEVNQVTSSNRILVEEIKTLRSQRVENKPSLPSSVVYEGGTF